MGGLVLFLAQGRAFLRKKHETSLKIAQIP